MAFPFWSRKKVAEAPAKRKAPTFRYAPRVKRGAGFVAANTGRLTASWTTQSVSADTLVYTQLQPLRARSRDQSYNGDYAKRFLGLVQGNVIGPKGVTFQSKAINNSGNPDKRARAVIEEALADWSKKKNFDLGGRLGFIPFQNLAIRTIAVDGELVVRKHRTGKYGLQHEIIDTELLDVQYNDTLTNGNIIKFGIEMDARNRPVAYHLTQAERTVHSYQSGYNSKYYERVPASDIYHVFLSEQVNQCRGLPWMGSTMLRMNMLGGFEDAALVNSRAGASKMGFFKSTGGEEYTGDGEDPDSPGDYIEESEPGLWTQLPAGVDVETYDPTYPNGDFAHFVKSCLRGISSGLMVSYNALANDLEGVNFSSMRLGAIEDRGLWMCLQNWIIDELIRPMITDWIESAHALGAIRIIDRNGVPQALSRRVETYLPLHLQGKRWDWVDPWKDIQTRKEEVGMGITSISQIIRDKGLDPDAVWDEIALERERLSELGFSIPTQQPGADSVAGTQTTDED